MSDKDTLTLKADLYRDMVVMPMHVDGRRVLPDLFESPIIGFYDGDCEEVDDIEDAFFVGCRVYGDDDPGNMMLVRLDYRGATVH